MNELREAAHQRNEADKAAAAARKRIDELIVQILRNNPTADRGEIAEAAQVSVEKVRDVARRAGIPRLRPGGRGRRITKADV